MTGDVPIRHFSKARRKVRDSSEVSDFRIHDLRRTCATNLTKLGFSRFVADCVLNHAQQGVGRVYDRYEYLKEKTEALDAWATRLHAILAENVVPIGSAWHNGRA
jgi:integrase